MATVRRFRLLAEAAGATELHACATSAMRTAANGDDIVDRIEAETGVDVEVISGRREAELIFGAIRAAVVLEPAPALCFDLGGGSVEIMVGDASGLRWAASEHLGVGRLTARARAQRPALEERPAGAARPPRRDPRTHRPPRACGSSRRLVVGSSGTLEDLAHMVAARRGTERPRVAQPADLHERRVPPAAQGDPRRPAPPSGSGSRDSRRVAST